jgi:orotidine-5'-phosphate decarboxylase
VLTPDQYAANVAPKPGSNDRVEFAIRLPGRETPCWLPIDAKFPIEDYERLHAAQERADPVAAEEAARALEAGADGVIASPHEAALIRALPQAKGRLIVTPGVRPAGAEAGDQKRIATPGQAIRDGADHIVVGRPVWQATDPRAAALAIAAELPARG